MFLHSRWMTLLLIWGSLLNLSDSFSKVANSHLKFNRNLNSLSDLKRNGDNKELSTSNSNTKDAILKNAALLVSCLSGSALFRASPASAAVVADELIANSKTAAKSFDPMAASQFASDVQSNRALNSDEFLVKFENSSLGLGLTETYYKGFPVTTVSSIKYPLNNPNDPEFRVSHPYSALIVISWNSMILCCHFDCILMVISMKIKITIAILFMMIVMMMIITIIMITMIINKDDDGDDNNDDDDDDDDDDNNQNDDDDDNNDDNDDDDDDHRHHDNNDNNDGDHDEHDNDDHDNDNDDDDDDDVDDDNSSKQ